MPNENVEQIKKATVNYVADIALLDKEFRTDAVKEAVQAVVDRGKQFIKDITKRSAEYVAEITAILAPGPEVEPQNK